MGISALSSVKGGGLVSTATAEAGTDAAQERTRQARTDMVSKFSRSAVADIVVERVRALAARRQRQLAKKSADAVEL